MFLDEFAFRLPAAINFVGGGGKTALILALAEEFSKSVPVIYTTTTRIHPPLARNGLVIISGDNAELIRLMLQCAGRDAVRTFVVTRGALTPDLLKGVEPDFGRHVDRDLFPVLLNEADGARSMSLKMPRAGEPVLMEDAQYLVPVLGLDCVNKPLGPETLFRWEMAAGRFSLREGEKLTPKLAADLLLHREGVCKDWRKRMEVIPFINKVDSERDDGLAQEVAESLLRHRRLPVKRVVWGSVRKRRVTSIMSGVF